MKPLLIANTVITTKKQACHLKNTKEIRALFNSKRAHILVAAFKAFMESGHEDKAFGKFHEWFVNGGNETVIE